MTRAILFLVSITAMLIMPPEINAQKYAVSPEVHNDRTITFRYFAPTAESVSLSGNVPQMAGSLKKSDDGIWSITVGPLEPDTYPYSFAVDKAKVMDPVNRNTKAWMWMENLVDVPADPSKGETPAIHQLQNVPHGSVHSHWYHSPRLNQTRQLYIYTPPGYEIGDETYPVLYLLHGFGDDQSAWSRVGKAQHISDNLLAAKKCKPAILVMPAGHTSLPATPDYQAYPLMKNLAELDNELINGVIPFVESNYRCKTDRKSRAIAGLSMGGGQTLHIGVSHLDQFGWIAGFSSSITKLQAQEAAKENLTELKSSETWLWLGCGKDDFLFEETVSFDKWLTEKSVPHTTRITEGAHNWRCWRGYLKEVLGEVFVEDNR